MRTRSNYSTKPLKHIWLISLFLLALACGSDSEEEVIAEAYGQQLFLSDIQSLISAETTAEDSVFLVKEYINNWVSQQVILHEAQSVLSEEERDKSEQLEAYEHDLISYETLNRLALQRMDSAISQEDLRAYYEANLKEFELTENIIKLVFVQLPLETEELDEQWSAFRSNAADYSDFAALASEAGTNYSMDSASWVYFDDILKEIPINTYNQEHFLNNNKNIKIKEGGFVYFVKILDFRIKSGTSPFELEQERIKKILFVKKQEASVKKVETELIQKAYNNNKVIIH